MELIENKLPYVIASFPIKTRYNIKRPCGVDVSVIASFPIKTRYNKIGF